MKCTLSPSGRITIPVKIRRKLGLKAGQVLELDESALVKAQPAGPVGKSGWEALRHAAMPPAEAGLSALESLNRTRGAVELPGETKA